MIQNAYSTPSGPIITVPGSKSYSLRALFLAAMTAQPVRLTGLLESEDTEAAIHCFETLGIQLYRENKDVIVAGSIRDIKDAKYELNVHQSGVTLRFLIALCSMLPGEQTIFGIESLNARPVAPLLDTLRQMGAEIIHLERDGHAPLVVKSSNLIQKTAHIDGSMSSQYISALLQIAPLMPEGLELFIDGHLASAPYVDMTIDTMATFGVTTQNDQYHKLTVESSQSYTRDVYAVEGDISSSAYFFAIATLTKRTITVTNVNEHSKQADMEFLDILRRMGTEVELQNGAIRVIGHGVQALSVDMERCPDQAMTMAVLAAFASGTTIISGVRTLRVKETERVTALENELAKMGIATKSTEDTLTVHGGAPHGAAIDTYGDHRIAMSFSMASLLVPDITINNPEVVRKTFPGYWLEFDKVKQERGK